MIQNNIGRNYFGTRGFIRLPAALGNVMKSSVTAIAPREP